MGRAPRFSAQLRVTGADSVDVFFTSSHNYKLSYADGFRTSTDPAAVSTARINAGTARPYAQLRQRHLADYQGIFSRFSLELDDPIHKNTPTDHRIKNYIPNTGVDRGLDALWEYRFRLVSTALEKCHCYIVILTQ